MANHHYTFFFFSNGGSIEAVESEQSCHSHSHSTNCWWNISTFLFLSCCLYFFCIRYSANLHWDVLMWKIQLYCLCLRENYNTKSCIQPAIWVCRISDNLMIQTISKNHYLKTCFLQSERIAATVLQGFACGAATSKCVLTGILKKAIWQSNKQIKRRTEVKYKQVRFLKLCFKKNQLGMDTKLLYELPATILFLSMTV